MAGKLCGVYAIRHKTTGKKYIGQSQDCVRRWREHKNDLLRGVHANPHLQNAWNKHGPEEFEFFLLESSGFESITALEQKYLDENVGKDHCYNIAKDVLAPSRGLKRTEETKQRMSRAQKGRVVSEETKNKLSESVRGFRHTEDAKKKISAAGKGRTPSAQTREKLRACSRCIPVVALDPQTGAVVHEFLSASEAERTGLFYQANISACLLGKLNKHAGFVWKRRSEVYGE